MADNFYNETQLGGYPPGWLNACVAKCLGGQVSGWLIAWMAKLLDG